MSNFMGVGIFSDHVMIIWLSLTVARRFMTNIVAYFGKAQTL